MSNEWFAVIVGLLGAFGKRVRVRVRVRVVNLTNGTPIVYGWRGAPKVSGVLGSLNPNHPKGAL